MNKNILAFFVVGCVLIFFIWGTDHESTVQITGSYYHFTTPLAGLLSGLLIFITVVYSLYMLLHKIVHRQFNEALAIADKDNLNGDFQSRDKIVLDRQEVDTAMMSLLQAMTSVTAGDMNEARRQLEKLRSIIGNDTIIDVLMLKIYKGEKDFDKMEELSSKLMNNPNLELISMKASLEAQMQKKEFEHALATANKAFEVRQDLYWVFESAFNLRAKANDWEGALQVLNSGYKKELINEEKYNLFKAVSLYQIAKDAEEHDDSLNFFRFCSQALDYCPTLVPAALDLAQYYIEHYNQTAKASTLLKKIWRCSPTTQIAEAYLNLFSQDTPVERVQRMENLALMNSLNPSINNLLLAELDIKAGFKSKAKSEFEIFLINNPMTKRLAKTIIEYEKKFETEHDFSKKFNNQTLDFAEDNKWLCKNCGHMSDKWQPTCKKCACIGTFRWQLYVNKKN